MCLFSIMLFHYILGFSQSQLTIHENNQCFQEKLGENNTNCRNLTELEKGILAFKMMNCHYQRAGRKTIECNFDDLPQCTKKLDSSYWNIFTQFYILVQHLCQIEVLAYLQSNVDKNLVNIQNDQQFINENLNVQLNKMADIIYFQNVIQNNTNYLMTYIQSQYNNIDVQRNAEQQKQSQLLDQMNIINQQINQYHEEIDNSFQELSFYYEIIKHYVDLIYNQELRLHQILFYFADLIALWILTSNRQLQEQRFTGFTFLLISLLFELFEFRYARQALVVNQLILLIYGYFSFKNYEELTYNKLRSIERKMAYFDLSNFKKKAKNLLMSTARKLNLNN